MWFLDFEVPTQDPSDSPTYMKIITLHQTPPLMFMYNESMQTIAMDFNNN